MQNLVILAGNVGASPESRTTTGGTKITNFSLATSRPKRDSNGKILKDDNNRRLEDTEWHRITCFHGVSKTVEHYVYQGIKVLVRGQIGRASCRARGCQYVYMTVLAVYLKNK